MPMQSTSLMFGGRIVEPAVITLDNLKPVIYDQKWLKESRNMPLHYLYRNCYLEKDLEEITSNKLQYDIFLISSRLLGSEYSKTLGHYMTVTESREGLTYPEVYEVIEGSAHFLIQTVIKKNNIENVILVKAKTADKVIVPPNYGVVIINPSPSPLKVARWRSSEARCVSKQAKAMKGFSYYETKRGFIKNPCYKKVPEINFREPTELEDLKITRDIPMYRLINKPAYLRFLNYPEKFRWIFSKISA